MKQVLVLAAVLAAGFILWIGCGVDVDPRPFTPSETVPEWVTDAVFYQIFPERFRNGDPSNDPTRKSLQSWQRAPESWTVSDWTADWYVRADWENEMGDDFYEDGMFFRRYGGDLQGVIDKLDYLADLGINAIYFNPLFHARSLHKYDGNTYHHIDPYFGPDPDGDLELMADETSNPDTWTWTAADRLFHDLLAVARARGIRIVLDGVWNHTGRDFFAFADLKERQEDSPYRDWYVVEHFDDAGTPEDEFQYKGWWGSRYLPEFADTPDGQDLHSGPKKYIFDATRRWMDPDGDGDPSDGIAGWRLDVVPDMPVGFWADWNAYVREINPKAYTVAEIWTDASRAVIDGGFSATMNYFAFAMPVKGFLVDDMISADVFGRLLVNRAASYPAASRFALLNLVDTHDTARIASMIVNRLDTYSEPDVFDYDRHSSPRNAPEYDLRKPNDAERRVQRMIALLQMAYAGPPMIYYGTEAGMWGADDPDDRMPMVWADLDYDAQEHHPRGLQRPRDSVFFDRELFRFYRDAIRLRKDRDVLRRGSVDVAGADSGKKLLAVRRALGEEEALVLINRSDATQSMTLPRPYGWTNVSVALSSTPDQDVSIATSNGSFTVHLPALTAVIIENPQQ